MVAWGGLDPIPLCCLGLHLLSDIYHTVKSDITLVEEAPYLMSPKPISRGGKKEKSRILEGKEQAESICLPLPRSACVFHLATGILRGCTTLLTEPHTHEVIEVLSLQAAHDAVLGSASSHACFCGLYFRSNNTVSPAAVISVTKSLEISNLRTTSSGFILFWGAFIPAIFRTTVLSLGTEFSETEQV